MKKKRRNPKMDLGVSPIPVPKSDPSFSSFKSKRYRDKLRTEIKALEQLLPVERTALHRKLDSQTVFRLAIAYFRTKLFMEAAKLESTQTAALQGRRPVKSLTLHQPSQQRGHPKTAAHSALRPEAEGPAGDVIQGHDLLQAMDGFLLVLTSDGTILYVSRNILHHLGFNQVDLMMRCMYGIVHPDDHQELKMVLEQTLSNNVLKPNNQQRPCCVASHSQSTTACRTISFLCRMKCFNGTTTGYLKMHCIGHMMSFPKVVRSQRTSNQVLFAFCRPFISVSTDASGDSRNKGFWSKHELDLKFRNMDEKISDTLGHSVEELEGRSMYTLLHPEDLAVFKACHKALTETEEIQTMYFRLQHKDGHWVWLHTRGKVVFKNSKKYSIVFTHCPVREEDSTYIQQEVILRQRYALHELMYGRTDSFSTLPQQHSEGGAAFCAPPASSGGHKLAIYGSLRDDTAATSLHDPHGQCPSSWHTSADRHSPVFPNNHLPHQSYKKDKGGAVTSAQGGGGNSSKLRKTQPGGVHANEPHQWIGGGGGGGGELGGYMYGNAGNGDPYNPCVYGSTDYDTAQQNGAKQYHMHINGVGFAPYPVPCPIQCSSTTLVFQGHVTTFESAAHEQAAEQQCQGHFSGSGSAPYGNIGPCQYWTPDGASPYQQSAGYANNNYLSQTPWEGWDRSKMADGSCSMTSDWHVPPGANENAARMTLPPPGVQQCIKEERCSTTFVSSDRRTASHKKHPSGFTNAQQEVFDASTSGWHGTSDVRPHVTACAGDDAIYGSEGATYMQIADGVTISTTRSVQKSETYISL